MTQRDRIIEEESRCLGLLNELPFKAFFDGGMKGSRRRHLDFHYFWQVPRHTLEVTEKIVEVPTACKHRDKNKQEMCWDENL